MQPSSFRALRMGLELVPECARLEEPGAEGSGYKEFQFIHGIVVWGSPGSETDSLGADRLRASGCFLSAPQYVRRGQNSAIAY